MIEWRPVAEFDGYEVSSTGLVRGRSGVLILRTDRKGYLFAAFRTDGMNCKRAVARLVAQAFIGPRPAGCVVRHMDGNKTNNTPANLAYGTPSQNEHDKRSHGTAAIGTKHPCAKLTEAQIIAIRSRYIPHHKTHGGSAMAREFGVSQMNISRIVTSKTWLHLLPAGPKEAP